MIEGVGNSLAKLFFKFILIVFLIGILLGLVIGYLIF